MSLCPETKAATSRRTPNYSFNLAIDGSLGDLPCSFQTSRTVESIMDEHLPEVTLVKRRRANAARSEFNHDLVMAKLAFHVKAQ